MNQYPSILYPPASGLGLRLHTFEKLDGSNLRFEWSRKRGWYKHGTRQRLFDATDLIFGSAVQLFQEQLADPCGRICSQQRWQRCVVFCEYWGPGSFAGNHEPADQAAGAMQLTVIDAQPHRQGLLPPQDFLDLFDQVGPEYLGLLKWNQRFMHRVAAGEIPGASFEGVVGKAIRKKQVLLYKAKTQQWRDRVRRQFPDQADKILAS